MNQVYHYYIEVPPSQTRLYIQIFDADIGAGAAIPEDDLNRDRLRNGNDTTATYSLRNPAGAVVTPRFTSGTNALPAGADNNWLTFYGTGNTVGDNFTTAAFSNNDGTANWDADWVETDGGGAGVGAGAVRISGGRLSMQDGVSGTPAMVRAVDLSAAGLDMGPAFLSYSYTTAGTSDNNDSIQVQVSTAGGGGPWTTLATYTDDQTGTANHDISAYRFANTQIRFIISNNYQTADEFFFIDNVLISDNAAAPAAGHWEVTVDQPNGTAINAIGIRAHDGDETSGGTEYNIYAESFLSLGTNPDASGGNSRNYILYPWVTAGCTSSHNDFDRDTDSGPIGSAVYTSRSGTFTQTVTDGQMSGNNEWADPRINLVNYTNNQVSSDYGIWRVSSTINTYDDAEGNYETYYVGNYLSAANPPTTQPLTVGGFPGAYRIYLPTDAGTAPVKPYLQQFLTAVNGPQPAPALGQARTYTVTVNIINPTPYSILFDSTHTIIAEVPGSGTVYAGSPQNPSQGSITSEPTVGNTGNVVWNPGAIAANSHATMSYDVTVTPAAASTPATGVATSDDGTRATYVDETGNTTQARATYRLGGLCELRVVVGAATEVMLASFEVDDRGHAWITASEAGTIGFNLYREDGSKVNEHLIPAGKRRYEVDDRYIAERYILEEVTASGKINRHGPLVTGRRLGPDVTKVADETPARLRFSSEAAPTIATDASKAVAVMASVRETGIVRVPFSELATRLGKSVDQISKSIAKGDLSVTNGRQSVAWTPTADAVLFFGEKSDSIYSKDRVYRIELKRGERMKEVAVGSSGAGVSIFDAKLDIETDSYPVSVLPLDPESDYCFWDFVMSGNPTYGRRTFTLDVPGMANASGATLQVRLQGAAKGTEHKARVQLNGVPVGELTWTDFGATTTTLALPAGVLLDGANQVEIEGVLAPSASYDVFFVDGFKVGYKRYARPAGGAIEAGLTGAIKAGPFNATPMALDITKRFSPTLLSGGSFAGGNLSMALPSGTKAVFAAESFVSPVSYRSANEPYLNTRRGDYIVIAPASMASGATALASLRQKSGGKGATMKTVVAELEQVYDEFSYGNVTPHAIRAYLAATKTWSPQPRFVVLAGTGTLDYRSLEQPSGPMPPMMISTPDGLYASDSKFADANNDGVPELAIGRIPVSSNAELLAYVAKLREHSASAATNPIAFTADAQDQGLDFGQASDESSLPLAGRPSTRLHVGEIGAQAARDGLLDVWQNDTPLVSWIGHGGVDQLANSGILTAGDAPSLLASGRLPVLVAMTCTINRFELGFTEALGSALTRQVDGGALAVWSATGLSNHEDARAMQRTFMKLAAENPQLKVGELIVRTLTAHPGETAGIYVLLGDPAIALELPKEISNDGPPVKTGE